MKKIWMVVVLVALLAGAGVWNSAAFGCSPPKECTNNYYGGDGGDASSNATAYGGKATVTNDIKNTVINSVGIGIKNDLSNSNIVKQGQDQSQGQGQEQGQSQSMGDQRNSQSISIRSDSRRGLANIPTAGGPAEALFREDTRYEADWRVLSVGSVLNRQSIWSLEEGKKLSANLHPRKMHKNLLRVMEQKTVLVEYTKSPPQPIDGNDMVIFLGYIPMSPDLKRGGLIAWLSSDGATDLTTANLIGNQVVAACEAGATHLIPVKDGFIRGGHSEVDFIGISGGATSVMENGSRATGVAGSIGPSRTTMDAWDMDRPYTVAEAWFRLSDVNKK